VSPAASRTCPLLLASLLLTSACANATPDSTGSAAPGSDRLAAGQPAEHASGHAHSAATSAVPAVAASPSPPAVVAAQQVADDPAVALRSELERLLGAHVLLADEVVRGQLLGREDVVRASSESIGRNTDELVEAVTSLAGPEIGEQFRTTWERHVEVLGQYATALEEGDEAGQQAARDAYGKAEGELATALSAVVGGKVPQADLTAATTAHGEHLLGQADAYAAKDYAKAAGIQRDAFAHMIVMADVLARGVAAAKGLPTTELDTPRRDLHSALSRLLAEHMGLMVQVLRATQDEAPDLAAAGEALNANTADLGAAIGTLFGAEASRQFLGLWAAHIEGLIDVARNSDDPEAQRAGREAQQQYAPQLARFLATATEERLPAIDLAAALTVHDDHLLNMTDAYAAEDYEKSQQEADAGYAHMMQLAGVLAVAIGETQAARLPQGGAATGGGGTAGRN
jgi:hypothetical protein